MTFPRKAMKRYDHPEVVVTDRLRSYRAAMKVIGITGRPETGPWLNNRAEISHQPFRRKRASDGEIQERHLRSRQNFKHYRAAALVEWRELAA
ncbi:MAG: IS6 family transposase [Rhodospirillaceae bacterium]|nr:IS6 family transposase [Rhodospirillaceae bacterium]MBT5667773.1 IS6 family transposase [Rhodospirillaceae bacterium]MBT5810022.1 IS6 family transposase [Rhodospirillaceae bacterium]